MRINRVTLFIFFLAGCVDPFEAETSATSQHIVVEGGITNQEPPYQVTLTTSANYSKNLDGLTRYISGASVRICDDVGQCMPLFEVEKGKYETALNVARGEPGKSYHVEVITADNKRAFSYPEKMISSPPISRAYSEFDPATVLEEGFQVYVDTDDPATEKNYYKWETSSYYPYSRFCFTREDERSIQHISSDKNVNGNTLSRIPVKGIPFTAATYWVVQVYQYAISAKAFEYLNGVKKQANSKGSIFDPPPSFLRGNLYNPDNLAEEVLGYFYVAGGARIDVVVDRSHTGQTPRPSSVPATDPLYCGDPCDQLCVKYGDGVCGNRPCPPDCASIRGKTNIAPDAWPLFHQECGN